MFRVKLCLAPCIHKKNNAQCACAFSSNSLKTARAHCRVATCVYLPSSKNVYRGLHSSVTACDFFFSFHLLLELKFPWRHCACFVLKVFQLLMFTQEQLRAACEVWKTFKDCMQRKNDQRCCLIWWWFAFLKGKRKMIKPWNWFKKFFSGMENFTFDRFGEFIVNSICNSHAIIYYISSHERSRTVFSAKKQSV